MGSTDSFTRLLHWVLLAAFAAPVAYASAQATRADRAEPIIFTVSGGTSRGAYQGGLNWGLVEIARLSRYDEAFRERIEAVVGRSIPRLHLTAAAGASAGNINGLLSAIEWCRLARPTEPEKSLFWKAWVWTGWEQLSWNAQTLRDHEHGLFDRMFFERVLLGAVQRAVDAPIYRTNCRVPVGVTTTRVQADTIAISSEVVARNQRFAIPFMVETDSSRQVASRDSSPIRFRQVPRAALEDPTMGVGIVLADPGGGAGFRSSGRSLDLPLARLFRAVEASSAYPVAFGPRTLAYHKAKDVLPGGPCARPGAAAERIEWACGREPQQGQFMDGGVFDNNPLGLAYALHRCVNDTGQPDSITRLARNAALCSNPAGFARIVYIDPDARRDTRGKPDAVAVPNDPQLGLSAVTRLVWSAVNSAREYELAVFHRTLQLLPEARVTITPTNRFQGIVGDYFNSFGAFLGRPFREYDYYVGVFDALYFAGTRWLCPPSGDGISTEATRDCVRRVIAAAVCGQVFDHLNLVGRSVLATLYEQELATLGGSPPSLVSCLAGIRRRLAAGDSVTRARVKVLTALAGANEEVRVLTPKPGDKTVSDPFDCAKREFLDEALCKGGFSRLLDAVRGERAALRTLSAVPACMPGVWMNPPNDALDECHSDGVLPRLVDGPIDETDRIATAALERLALVERGRSLERAVEAAQLAYNVGVEPNVRGWVPFPASIPRAGGRFESIFRLLPYEVSNLAGTSSFIFGYRPTLYQPFPSAKRLQIVTPLAMAVTARRDGTRDPGHALGATAGVGLGWLFGNVVVENVQLTTFCHFRAVESPDRRCLGGELAATGLLGRLRLGYRRAPRADREELGVARGALVVGFSDVSGLLYWPLRIYGRGVPPCYPPRRNPRELQRGDSVTALIAANDRNSPTGVRLVKNGVYRFRATGLWKDGGLPPVSARGSRSWEPWYATPVLGAGTLFKRLPAGRWFELTGKMHDGSNKYVFPIGESLDHWRSPASGTLVAFANDVNFRYGNNSGCVTLTVTRIQ